VAHHMDIVRERYLKGASPSMSSARPIVMAAGQGRAIGVGPNTITYKMTGEQTSGRAGVIGYEIGPRFVAPPVLHWHTKEAWTAHIVRGAVRFKFASGAVELGEGGTVHVPAYCPFAWENPADEPAHMVCVYTPGGFESYFSDVNALQSANPGKSIPELMPQL